jgi:hypothetical protein
MDNVYITPSITVDEVVIQITPILTTVEITNAGGGGGGGAGTTALAFSEIDLISMGGGFFKLALVLSGTSSVLAVKIAITDGNKYQKPASDWQNDELINFDSNVPQLITVIIS